MSNVMYGYARVSARDQNLNRQLDAFAAFGIEPRRIFADKMSGADFNRPAYRRLKRALKPGDTMVIKSIDRLGRNYDEILEEWRFVTKVRRASIVVLDMPLLDTRSRDDGVTSALICDIVLQLLSYVAQVERENIKARQAEGIAAAKLRGVRFGRPRKERPSDYGRVVESYLGGQISRDDAAERLGISVSTFYRWRREDRDGVSGGCIPGL